MKAFSIAASVSIIVEGPHLPCINCLQVKKRSDLGGSWSSYSDFRCMVTEKGQNPDRAPGQGDHHGTTHKEHWPGQWMSSDHGSGKKNVPKSSLTWKSRDRHRILPGAFCFLEIPGLRGLELLQQSSPNFQPSSRHHSQASFWSPGSWPGPSL